MCFGAPAHTYNVAVPILIPSVSSMLESEIFVQRIEVSWCIVRIGGHRVFLFRCGLTHPVYHKGRPKACHSEAGRDVSPQRGPATASYERPRFENLTGRRMGHYPSACILTPTGRRNKMVPEMLSHYRIQKKLGAGGMGEGYKALDTRLSRTVVIKVLPRELTAREANLKRFAREARLASSLDHPNICTIFDLDESEGIHFIAMQYIEGRNLRQVVDGRALELESALSIAIQVGDALAAAHARGIIHRDVKSGNVMVTDSGAVKVLDFGLAKLLDDDTARAGGIHQTELTELGVPYGTPTHAAPEQARGGRVDSRADIFSTGVILYEMLTGTWPFRGKTAIDVRHAVLHDTPQPLAIARSGPLPPRLQPILDKALAKEPRDRYQKMTELVDDLRKVLVDISAPGRVATAAPARHQSGTGAVARAVRWLRSIASSEPAGAVTGERVQITDHKTPTTSFGDSEKKSLAILPFKNMSKDEASSFYEFSLADAVITELARLRSLVVRPSSVIARFQGREYDPL